MNENKEMNVFLSSLHMGTATLRELERITKNLETKKIFIEILDRLAKHEQMITDTIVKLNCDPTDRLTCGEKMIIMMCKMKAKKKSDFEITMYGIDAIQKGIQGALTFLYEHADLNPIFLHVAVEVLEDYDNILTRLKEHATSFLSLETYKEQKSFEQTEE